ncbi:MAG: helix-turn-helix transcriptional regulator [Bacteroidota bacterium]
MMEKSNINLRAMSDKALLTMLGNFIKEQRIRQNKTQEEVAEAAGINRTTLIKMENGSSANMLSFVQVLRAIDHLELLVNFEIKEQISPLLLAKIEQSKRQRASRKS